MMLALNSSPSEPTLSTEVSSEKFGVRYEFRIKELRASTMLSLLVLCVTR